MLAAQSVNELSRVTTASEPSGGLWIQWLHPACNDTLCSGTRRHYRGVVIMEVVIIYVYFYTHILKLSL